MIKFKPYIPVETGNYYRILIGREVFELTSSQEEYQALTGNIIPIEERSSFYLEFQVLESREIDLIDGSTQTEYYWEWYGRSWLSDTLTLEKAIDFNAILKIKELQEKGFELYDVFNDGALDKILALNDKSEERCDNWRKKYKSKTIEQYKRENPSEGVKEFSVDVHDLNFLMIYGKHINGYFLAVPNWRISCELGESESVSYNAVMIARALENVMQDVSQEERNAIAKELAEEIKNRCN